MKHMTVCCQLTLLHLAHDSKGPTHPNSTYDHADAPPKTVDEPQTWKSASHIDRSKDDLCNEAVVEACCDKDRRPVIEEEVGSCKLLKGLQHYP